MCINCVKEQCRRIRFESRLAEDYKFVSDTLKSQTSLSDKFFWVGRRSLLRWKALAIHHEEARQSLMDRCQVTANYDAEEDDEVKVKGIEDHDVSMTEEEKAPQQMDENPQEIGAEEDEDDSDSKFNEDLLCEHGDLSSDESCRRLVPDVVWQRLKYYFSCAPEFQAVHPVCRSCQAEDEEERQKNETYKLLASEQRAAVSQLYLDRNRPSLDNDDPFVACAISKSFLDQWRQFLRYPARNVPPDSIVNAPLLCPHEKFLFNPECDDDMDGANEELCYVWQHEWNTLTQTYPYDHVITVTKSVTEDDVRELVTSPDVCTECCYARIQERAQHVENYRYGTIYVRKITKDHTEKDIQQALNDSTSSKDVYSFDPDFQTPPNNKKPKLNRDSRARRSSRHRKQRGEVSLTVGSTETLRDVKLQVTIVNFCFVASTCYFSTNNSKAMSNRQVMRIKKFINCSSAEFCDKNET
ncbi:ubiquitin carboxyl-terminal hydrolase 48-like [Orbicella faveolata]|uniref:ubiquitin carboxyl-terminal hydrolase 48-like n=1 Tax=Orbicella faveolata TaxID=48498 RepID=UPI0009E37FA6|nr:ubiquitin carboxyl-terminal hydrolase 48-like [Orbicella faveolata]